MCRKSPTQKPIALRPSNLRSATFHPPAAKTTPTKRSSSTRKCIGTFGSGGDGGDGGGSVQFQLEVQQIGTFDSDGTFGSGGSGHGQVH